MVVVLLSNNSDVCYHEFLMCCFSLIRFTSLVPSLPFFVKVTSNSMSTGKGTSMAAKLEEVLQAVRDVESKVDDKLLAMKCKMESADDRLVKKVHLDTKPTFKKRGHEKQYQFNELVWDKVDAATAALEQTPLAVEQARTFLKEGEKFIILNQKNILIADRSEHGWVMVAEDELADN